METVLMIFIIEIFNIIAFMLGARLAYQFQNKEEIKMPNPIKATKQYIEEFKENKETEKQRKETNIMLENIDNYDGSSAGQKDIP